MQTRECVAGRIVELCAKNNLSFRKLAYAAGVPPTTIMNILNGKSQNPGIVTIKKICDGLNISLIEFFDTDEFRSLEQEIQ